MFCFILGIALPCILYETTLMPRARQESERIGNTAGYKSGKADGRADGFKEGIAFMEAKARRTSDSLDRIAAVQKAERKRKAEAAQRARSAYVQNWHVIDGKIADPITE